MRTAIVMAGAGARGAYEAGVLAGIASDLEQQGDELIVVGTSAGAINAAAFAGNIDRGVAGAAKAAASVWREIDTEDVFDLNGSSLFAFGAHLLGGVVPPARVLARTPIYSLLDTDRLAKTVSGGRFVNWQKFPNVTQGTPIKAVAVATTSASPSASRVFVQGQEAPPDRAQRAIYYKQSALTAQHVLASAAIPVAFAPVDIPNEGFFLDGGVHLNTPIVPALDLGAERIVIIATHPDPSTPQPEKKKPTKPDVFEASASIMTSLLVDRVAEDVRGLRTINDELASANVPLLARGGASQKLRVPHAYFGPPSADLIAHEAGLAFDIIDQKLSTAAILGRLLGPLNDSRKELLSFLLFDRHYLTRLVDLGAQHAKALLKSGAIDWQG